MSDSELSDDPGTPVPSDNELEQSLRREVFKVSSTGDDVTVKRVRAASEKRLGLPEGFYKSHETWNDKSKIIIKDQAENEGDVPSSPVLKKSKSAKRKSAEPEEAPTKKRKVSKEDSSEELSSVPSEAEEESEPEKKPKKTTKKSKALTKATKEPTKKKSAKSSKDQEPPKAENGDASKEADGNKSDSDLSVLIDEEPAKKKRSKSNSQDKSKKVKSSSKAKDDEDPDQTEIKRLQGWLVKCGIRKVWGKELKPYETPKAKIKHLKDMLSEAGMTGRYSIEKATQIKEKRELEADIEAVKEGEERWGTGEQDEASEESRPQRKLVRGSKHFDFLSSDGEETD